MKRFSLICSAALALTLTLVTAGSTAADDAPEGAGGDTTVATEMPADSAGSVREEWPTLREAIGANLEQGYIIPTAGLGNIDPLLFEAQVSPYYALRLGKGHDALVFAFKTIVRMRYEEGFPVETPSYMPRLIYYHYGPDLRDSGHDYYYVMLSHHSNGQKGRFYNPDGTVNTVDGEFSTNYLEVGLFTHPVDNWFNFHGGVAAQVHLPINRSKELEEVHYGFYRVKYWHTFLLGSPEKVDRKSRLTFSTFVILGPLHDAEAWDHKRLGLDVSLRHDFDWFDNLDFYMNFYTGQDYYNIQYSEYITVLRVGIIGDVGL